MVSITQSKFSKVSNLIFLTFCTFLISFIWLNNYISNIRLTFISSIIIALFFCVTYLVFKHFQNKIYTLNKKQKLSIEDLKTHLLFSNYQDVIEVIKNAFNLNNLIKLGINHYLDNNTNTDIFLLFEKETISYDDYIYIYKNRINNHLRIFCINNTPNHPELENTTIEVFNLNQISKALQNNNSTIINYAKFKNKPKLNLKSLLSITLNKTRSRNYFLFGLLIIFTSIYTPYYIYYIIIGTILLLISLYSRFNSRFN